MASLLMSKAIVDALRKAGFTIGVEEYFLFQLQNCDPALVARRPRTRTHTKRCIMKRLSTLFVVCLLSIITGDVFAQGSLPTPGASKKLKSQKDKTSYAIGFDFGLSLLNDEVDANSDIVVKGFLDAINKQRPLLTDKEIGDALTQLQRKMAEKQAAQMKALGEKNKVEGVAFLKANRTKPGVKTMENGLQYEILKSGKGKAPALTDMVRVHYRGTLIDGQEFDSTTARGVPAVFRVSGVIPGWTEALRRMKVGSKWKLYIPPELAYRDQGAPPLIGPHAVLIFEVELLAIEE